MQLKKKYQSIKNFGDNNIFIIICQYSFDQDYQHKIWHKFAISYEYKTEKFIVAMSMLQRAHLV